jgi:hypothetical protein
MVSVWDKSWKNWVWTCKNNGVSGNRSTQHIMDPVLPPEEDSVVWGHDQVSDCTPVDVALHHLKTTLHLTGKRKERSDRVAYKCDHCIYESHNKNNYLTHVLNNHSTREERERGYKFYCKKCDFGVFTKTAYDLHLTKKKHQIKTIS